MALATVVLLCDCARSQSERGFQPDPSPAPTAAESAIPPMVAPAAPSIAEEAWRDYRDPGVEFFCQPPGPDYWTIDYRCRAFCSSYTTYEFGTPPETNPGWAPLSRLNFSLNSCWHGLQIAHETPTWAFQLEWLMAGQYIQGDFEDYDWRNPNNDFTDLGFARERWTEGQMLDLGFKRQLFDRPLGLPVEVWPMIGFRWQRLDVVAYDAEQVKFKNQWLDPPLTVSGDVIDFNQQYYIGYAGAQLRGRLETKMLPPLIWTLQGDWGWTEAYDIDHHLLREGDMYTMNRTHGDCWHAAVSVEALVTNRFSFGVQADHLQINTTGSHHWLNDPLQIDETWNNGVSVSSQQNWITAFLRVRI